jgi:hypothetical protein
MVSDLKEVTEHIIRSVFHHSIVQVHVVVNVQGWLVSAWFLRTLVQTTSFKL